YRFKDGDLRGHNFGNLLLCAGQLMTGDMQSSIEMAKKLLNIEQDIFPIAERGTELILEQEGQEVRGDFRIVKEELEAPFDLRVEPQLSASKNVIEAISNADVIIIAPGNFYCSVIPQFMYGGIKEAIEASDAKLIMLSNLVNFVGHTDDFDVQDYIEELQRITGVVPDTIIYNVEDIPMDILSPGVKPVGFRTNQPGLNQKFVGTELVSKDIIKYDATDTVLTRSLVRHDKEKLYKAILEVIGSL
ncbi:MAG TPA: 2-phospho-L-lactate transferase CofD family protein, partial [Patescibacteria group bacterium]|nr:2-phospho-L-lactate transferase CofD family protein [Patescibacteria group bacterium]